ncbi:hypothetical protein, partial [Mycobacteroides abscessus]
MAVSFDEQAGDRGPQAVFSANCLNRRHESSWLFQWQPARSRSIVNTVASSIATLVNGGLELTLFRRIGIDPLAA